MNIIEVTLTDERNEDSWINWKNRSKRLMGFFSFYFEILGKTRNISARYFQLGNWVAFHITLEEIPGRGQRRIGNVIGPVLAYRLHLFSHRRNTDSVCFFYKYASWLLWTFLFGNRIHECNSSTRIAVGSIII